MDEKEKNNLLTWIMVGVIVTFMIICFGIALEKQITSREETRELIKEMKRNQYKSEKHEEDLSWVRQPPKTKE